LVLVLPIPILDRPIGIANRSTNTNTPRISRMAKYNRQLSVENHINAMHYFVHILLYYSVTDCELGLLLDYLLFMFNL